MKTDRLAFKSLILFLTASLSSCTSHIFYNNSLPHVKADILASYDEDGIARIYNSKGIDVTGYDLIDIVEPTTIKNLYVGDELYVYYKSDESDEIDHIFVNQCEMIEVHNEVVPNFPDPNVLVEITVYPRTDVHVLDKNIDYVINEDGTYTNLNTLVDQVTLYGSYNVSENSYESYNSTECTRITLKAVYSFDFTKYRT